MEKGFIVTAWNNGQHHQSGAGYGLKVAAADRDKYFTREWKTVALHLPTDDEPIHVNINKPSFWNDTCRELISADIGRWLLATGNAPWPSGSPPKVLLSARADAVFDVRLA